MSDWWKCVNMSAQMGMPVQLFTMFLLVIVSPVLPTFQAVEDGTSLNDLDKPSKLYDYTSQIPTIFVACY